MVSSIGCPMMTGVIKNSKTVREEDEKFGSLHIYKRGLPHGVAVLLCTICAFLATQCDTAEYWQFQTRLIPPNDYFNCDKAISRIHLNGLIIYGETTINVL